MKLPLAVIAICGTLTALYWSGVIGGPRWGLAMILIGALGLAAVVLDLRRNS